MDGDRIAKVVIPFTYDPNSRRIAELAIGQPPIYLQMQADLVEPAIARLPAGQRPSRLAEHSSVTSA